MPHHNGSPRSFVKGFILFTYLRDCPVKTELVCRDNYAKNSLNRFQIGCIVYRQFSMSLAFESTSGQWARSAENGTSAFCDSSNILSTILSHTPCGLSSLIQYHFFSETGPMNYHCPFSKSPCVQRYEFGIRQAFFFVVFWSTENDFEH